MSEEKKAYAGAAYAGSEVKPASVEGGAPPPAGEAATDSPEGAARPRGQAVLPGILGKQLRTAYGELLNAPVPDRFNDLIKELQQKEAAAALGNSDEEENA